MKWNLICKETGFANLGQQRIKKKNNGGFSISLKNTKPH